MVKSQIEGYVSNKTQYIDGVLPGQVTNNKASTYSPSGGVHSKALYLKDQYGQKVHFYTEDQDDNQIRLYIPNLKNNDSYGGRRKSSVVVTSIDQTIEGKMVFNDIEVPQPVKDNQAYNKKYVDDKLQTLPDNSKFVQKKGDTMTGPLIVPKDNYPVQGDLNKVISYEAQREIFMSKKEGGQMEQPIDMGGSTIENLPTPTQNDHACSKGYADGSYLNLRGGVISGIVNMNRNDLIYIPDTPKFSHSAVNKTYVESEIAKIPKIDTTQFINKDGSVSMEANLDMNYKLIENVRYPLKKNDSATKGYLEDKLSESHLISSSKENAFKYLLDPNESTSYYNVVVNGVNDFSGSPHKNKKAYDLILQKDAATFIVQDFCLI